MTTAFNDLKHDAEKALAILAQQPEVDPGRITIIGHSEGTTIVPRVAIDSNNTNNNSTTPRVPNIVLMVRWLRTFVIYYIFKLLAYHYYILKKC